MYKSVKQLKALTLCASLAILAGNAWAFESGSTGADGVFSPTVNTLLELPPSGVFNFSTVNIPAGVTVTFKPNTTNTPVVLLASGNVTIAGTLLLSGVAGSPAGATGDGNIGDDGLPGIGGSGGYSGGSGGVVNTSGGYGAGPGGGEGGILPNENNRPQGGGGGSFGTVGTASWPGNTSGADSGKSYGSSQLLPLIGGSGGGGGTGGSSFSGGGGGGGGGAILIASSGIVNITGAIRASGGLGGTSDGSGCGSAGGSGSGGAIRIVATTIQGNGTLSAIGGTTVSVPALCGFNGGAGGTGRVRLEAESFTRTAASNPVHTFSSPGSIFISGLPTLKITNVAGVAVPAIPTGNADVILPSTTPNPISVSFNTTGVPVGNTVKLTIKPASGASISAVSPALTGTTESATATVSINLPSGPSVLEATTTYTIVVAMGEALSQYAQGERVEKITLASVLGGESKITLITVTGKEFTVPAAVLAAMPS